MKIALPIVAVVLATSSSAEANKMTEQCSEIAKLASTIMDGRQNGVSMSAMMDVADGQELSQTLIIKAFEDFNRPTSKGKQEAVTEFSNQWYLECVRQWQAKHADK